MRSPSASFAILPSGSQDLPTLRLRTLRRELVGVLPPIVLDARAPLIEVERALIDAGGGLAILVDASGVFQGTVSLAELRAADDGRAAAATRMSSRVPMMEPESEVEGAMRAMGHAGVEHVLVVAADGALLGVLSRRDLERRAARR